jgi:hypothetical protein
MQQAHYRFSIESKFLGETRRFTHYELETRGKGIVVATVCVLSLSCKLFQQNFLPVLSCASLRHKSNFGSFFFETRVAHKKSRF